MVQIRCWLSVSATAATVTTAASAVVTASAAAMVAAARRVRRGVRSRAPSAVRRGRSVVACGVSRRRPIAASGGVALRRAAVSCVPSYNPGWTNSHGCCRRKSRNGRRHKLQKPSTTAQHGTSSWRAAAGTEEAEPRPEYCDASRTGCRGVRRRVASAADTALDCSPVDYWPS